MFKYELATSLTLNIEKYCYSYLNGLADLWCLRGRCLPIQQDDSTTSTKKRGQNEEQNLKLADL